MSAVLRVAAISSAPLPLVQPPAAVLVLALWMASLGCSSCHRHRWSRPAPVPGLRRAVGRWRETSAAIAASMPAGYAGAGRRDAIVPEDAR